jgi:hypothetical protein
MLTDMVKLTVYIAALSEKSVYELSITNDHE